MNTAGLSGLVEPKTTQVRRIWLAGAIIVAMAALLSSLTAQFLHHERTRPRPAASADVARLQLLTEGGQADIVVSGADADRRNKLIPVSGYSGGLVPPFRAIEPNSSAYSMARKCLTQAIYYEAANEPTDGQRAVAQVVLNRVRHPAYPHSVCGVVYEGWNQATCQFTFVCDGSLLRRPMTAKWREAEEIATEALAGQTEQAVGSATNYHADYVVPRWAYTLPKITQLGAHIFYRLPGRWGSVRALTSQWVGNEAIPDINFANLKPRLAAETQEESSAATQLVPGLSVTPSVTDRHAPADVGGRIDTTKSWRLTIPLPLSREPEPALANEGVDIEKGRGQPL